MLFRTDESVITHRVQVLCFMFWSSASIQPEHVLDTILEHIALCLQFKRFYLRNILKRQSW